MTICCESFVTLQIVRYLLLGAGVTAGILCIVGSAIYFMSTGISHSQTLKDLSSEVVTNLLFSSTNVIEFTAPKCRSYSCTMSPDRTSQQIIFLSEVPATKRCCRFLSGLNLTQYGIFRLVNRETTCPVSVFHNLMYLKVKCRLVKLYFVS